MKRSLALRLTRRHLWLFFGLHAGFSVLTFWFVFRALTVDDASARAIRVALCTAATVLGPFTGAITPPRKRRRPS